MGLRNPSRLSIDPETDIPYTAWVGPDAGVAERDRRPVDVRERRADRPRRQLRLALLHGQRPGLPRPPRRRRRCARPTRPATCSGGPATGGTDGWYDCDNIRNDSPNNTGLTELPHETGTGMDAGKMRRDNLWCSRGNPATAQRLPAATRATAAPANAPNYGGDADLSCARTRSTSGMTVMNGPVYRYDDEATDDSRRWPEYWDGRWFLHNNGGASVKHGLLLDPATDQDGGQPVYADSLRNALSWPGSYMDSKFGPDGALYVQVYDGFFRAGPNVGIYRYNYTGGAGHAVRQPERRAAIGNRTVEFSSAGSGGVSVRVGLRRRRDVDRAPTRRTPYAEAGQLHVELTVTYADGTTDVKTIPVDVLVTSDDMAPVTTHALSPALPARAAASHRPGHRHARRDGRGRQRPRARRSTASTAAPWKEYERSPTAEQIFDGSAGVASPSGRTTPTAASSCSATTPAASGGPERRPGHALVPEQAVRRLPAASWSSARAATDGGFSNGGVFVRFPNPDETPARRAAIAVRPAGAADRDAAGVGGDLLRPRDPALRQPGRRRAAEDRVDLQLRPHRHHAGAAASPKGEWNDYEIEVVGQQLPIFRNGKVINEFDNSPDKTVVPRRRSAGAASASSRRATSACRTTAAPT